MLTLFIYLLTPVMYIHKVLLGGLLDTNTLKYLVNSTVLHYISSKSRIGWNQNELPHCFFKKAPEVNIGLANSIFTTVLEAIF